MIKIKETQEKIINTLNTLVGKDAPVCYQLFNSPVIKAIGGGNKPPFPYVVVFKLPVKDYGYNGELTEQYDDEGNLQKLFNYKMSFLVQVHGGNDDDTQTICKMIKRILFTEWGKSLLETNTGTALLDISDPDYSFNFMQTEYEEVSRIKICLTATDVFTEDSTCGPTTPIIDTVETTGEIEDISLENNL